MSAKGHLRISERPHKYACGVETNRWVSTTISSHTNPYGVTCGSCKKTDAFKAAMKAADGK